MNEKYSTTNALNPVLQPGDSLPTVRRALIDLMTLHKIRPTTLAKHLGVPKRQIDSILDGRRHIKAIDALMLEAALGTCAEYWLALQAASEVRRDRAYVAAMGIKPIWEVQG